VIPNARICVAGIHNSLGSPLIIAKLFVIAFILQASFIPSDHFMTLKIYPNNLNDHGALFSIQLDFGVILDC